MCEEAREPESVSVNVVHGHLVRYIPRRFTTSNRPRKLVVSANVPRMTTRQNFGAAIGCHDWEKAGFREANTSRQFSSFYYFLLVFFSYFMLL